MEGRTANVTYGRPAAWETSEVAAGPVPGGGGRRPGVRLWICHSGAHGTG